MVWNQPFHWMNSSFRHFIKWLTTQKLCYSMYDNLFLSGILCKMKLTFLLVLVWTLALQASCCTKIRQRNFLWDIAWRKNFTWDPTFSDWSDMGRDKPLESHYLITMDDTITKLAVCELCPCAGRLITEVSDISSLSAKSSQRVIVRWDWNESS